MAEKITFDQFMKEKIRAMEKAYVVASMTDQYYIARLEDLLKDIENSSFNSEKVIEMRVFNENREDKIFRMSIGKKGEESKYLYRKREDDVNAAKHDDSMFDEKQYLDINTEYPLIKENGYFIVEGTRGGIYRLPLEKSINDAMVELRYYVARDEETGQARVSDWRLIRFVEGK